MKVRVPTLLISVLFLGLISVQAVIRLQAQEGEAEQDLSLLLPDEEGKILVAAYCSMCHSLKNTLVGSRNQEQWVNTIDKMVFEYHAPISEEEVEVISSYLEKHAGPKNPIKEIPMDINTVSREALARLSFLSNEDGQRIMQFREEKGPLSDIEQLAEVVNTETIKKLRPYLTIHPR